VSSADKTKTRLVKRIILKKQPKSQNGRSRAKKKSLTKKTKKSQAL